MRKIILLSFANTDYSDSLARLKKETESFPFDERFFFNRKGAPARIKKENSLVQASAGLWLLALERIYYI